MRELGCASEPRLNCTALYALAALLSNDMAAAAALQVVAGTSLGITAPPGFPSLTTLNVGGEVRLQQLFAPPCHSVLFCFDSLAAAPGRMARDAGRLIVEAPSQRQALRCAVLGGQYPCSSASMCRPASAAA